MDTSAHSIYNRNKRPNCIKTIINKKNFLFKFAHLQDVPAYKYVTRFYMRARMGMMYCSNTFRSLRRKTTIVIYKY